MVGAAHPHQTNGCHVVDTSRRKGPPRRGVGTLPRRPLDGPGPRRGGEVVARPRDWFRWGRGVRPTPAKSKIGPTGPGRQGSPGPGRADAAVYAHIFAMIVMEIESPPESEK